MPRPLTDRQRWQEELDELPAQIAWWEKELASLAPDDRVRREMLEWMIRRARRRLETLAAVFSKVHCRLGASFLFVMVESGRPIPGQSTAAGSGGRAISSL